MNTRRLRPVLVIVAMLAAPLLGPPAGAGDGEPPPAEVFRTPGGVPWRVVRDAGGGKSLVGPAGERAASVEEILRAEEAGLTGGERRLHPSLRALAADGDAADTPVRVVLVLRRQPLHEAAVAARALLDDEVAADMAALRDGLDAIGPSRAEDPGGDLSLGHRIEEEGRLLGEARRAALRELRESIQRRVRARRAALVEEGFAAADLLTAPVADAVAAVPGGVVLGRSRVLCAVSAGLRAGDLLPLLDALPQVERVLPHGTRRSSLDVSVPTAGASSWTGAGYDGTLSTKVAVMDTGVDAAHPALSTAVTGASVHLDVGRTNPYFQDDGDSTDDIHGHGTHVSGIVGSRDATYAGVAPGCGILNAKCGYLLVIENQGYGSLEDADIMAAGDWAASAGADAVNASFGGGGTTDGSSALALWFEALVDDLGITAAVAAGNDGPGSGTVGIPGDAFNVITVGALDDKGTTSHTDNGLASFSSRGPLDDGRRKPDLSAPGSSISSSNAGWEGAGADWVPASGTSMATPHVAGAAALLYDYAATWRPEGLKALLAGTTRNTSPYPTAPDNDWGTGGMNLAAAFTSRVTVKEGVLRSSGPEFVFLRSGILSSGKRATLCWNREVVSNGPDAPVTYRTAVDLDLYVYEESDDTARGSSTSLLNNLEQVKLSSGSTFPILKVRRAGPMPSGQTEVRWAVATEATTSTKIVTPPTLTCAFTSLPAKVRGGQEFPVEVTVTNDGELPATYPVVTLEPPAGYVIVEGDNPRTVITIPAVGDTRVVTWTVRAATTSAGARTFTASATTRSFQEDFASPDETVDQVLDLAGPTGVVALASGAAAAPNPTMPLRVIAGDDRSGVVEMRVRNEGDDWGAWKPYVQESTWTVPAGDGDHEVEVVLRDGVGNESAVLSDTILLDTAPPVGSFTLAGGRPYLMPWENLTAATVAEDGEGGSGVAEFRVRWLPSTAWTGWLPPDGDGVVPLARPAGTTVTAEGEFRDVAGNLSWPSVDSIELVADDSPSLDAVGRWSGTLDPGGDVDGFVLDLVAGDELTVKVKAKAAVKKGDLVPSLDLYGPGNEPLVTDRFPSDGRKPGIARWPVAATGRHRLVLRGTGADGDGGGSVTLSIKVKQAPGNRKASGPASPDGETGWASFPFAATAGSTVNAVMKRPGGTGGPELQGPTGDPLSPEAKSSGDGRTVKLKGVLLDGETGTWVLRLPATGPVEFKVTVKPPQRGKATE